MRFFACTNGSAEAVARDARFGLRVYNCGRQAASFALRRKAHCRSRMARDETKNKHEGHKAAGRPVWISAVMNSFVSSFVVLRVLGGGFRILFFYPAPGTSNWDGFNAAPRAIRWNGISFPMASAPGREDRTRAFRRDFVPRPERRLVIWEDLRSLGEIASKAAMAALIWLRWSFS